MTRNADRRASHARRLIAGLRISAQDEALLDAVRPFFPEHTSEGELAYRLWRRGLELALAEAASVGAAFPAGTSEEQIVSLVAQRLLLCLPLLRRSGMLYLLEVAVGSVVPEPSASHPAAASSEVDTIDESAAKVISGLGASKFL